MKSVGQLRVTHTTNVYIVSLYHAGIVYSPRGKSCGSIFIGVSGFMTSNADSTHSHVLDLAVLGRVVLLRCLSYGTFPKPRLYSARLGPFLSTRMLR